MTANRYRTFVEGAGWQPGSDLEDVAAYVLLRAGHQLGDVVQQHRVRDFRLDFAWPRLHIALEVDGPQHFSPYQAARDANRDAELRSLGWLVIRVDAQEDIDGLRRQVAEVSRLIHIVGRGWA